MQAFAVSGPAYSCDSPVCDEMGRGGLVWREAQRSRMCSGTNRIDFRSNCGTGSLAADYKDRKASRIARSVPLISVQRPTPRIGTRASKA